MKNSDLNLCRLCKSEKIKKAFEFKEQPIVHNFLTDNKNRQYYKNDFVLYECLNCGFLFCKDYFRNKNILYENYITLSSQKKQPHQELILSRLKTFRGEECNRLNLLEIGCNDGTFLDTLKNNGFKNLKGIEPTNDAYNVTKEKGFDVEKVFFSSVFAQRKEIQNKYDLVITRQVLEHICELDDFLQGINIALKKDGILIIEVPDHSMNYELSDYTFWEEHVNYFTINTLKQLLAKHGLFIFHHDSILFSGKAIIIYCQKISDYSINTFQDYDIKERSIYISNFSSFKSKVHRFMQDQLESGKEILVFGAGCRGCNFVNMLDIKSYLKCFVDDSKTKSGKFTPLSHKHIINSTEINKDSIILMATNTESEESVLRRINLRKENVYSILPPSHRIPNFWKQHIMDTI